MKQRGEETLLKLVKQLENHDEDMSVKGLYPIHVGILYGAKYISDFGKELSNDFLRVAHRAEKQLNSWNIYNQNPHNVGIKKGKTPYTIEYLDKTITKARLGQYDSMTPMEIEFAEGILTGIYACRNRQILSLDIVKNIRILMESGGINVADITGITTKKFITHYLFPGAAILLVFVWFGNAIIKEARSQDTGPKVSALAIEAKLRPKRTTHDEKLSQTIRKYENQIAADPESEESAALRFALGNIYLNERSDYLQAIIQFDSILIKFPDWPMLGQVYTQLENCYLRLDDEEGIMDLYENMLEYYEEGSTEHTRIVSNMQRTMDPDTE